MFLLDGNPLSPDVQFVTSDGAQYPANWLRLASPEEREAIGITEAPDPEQYDQRYYWGPGNPKDLEPLKEQTIAQIKRTAGTLLVQTDWRVIRAAEGGVPVDQATLDSRAAIRAKSNEFESAVSACSSVDALAALKFEWPKDE